MHRAVYGHRADEIRAVELLIGMIGAYPRSPPNALFRTDSVNRSAYCRGLVVYHSDRHFIRDYPDMVSEKCLRYTIMSRPTEQTHVIASSFSGSEPRLHCLYHSVVPLTGMKAPLSPPTRRSHYTAPLTLSLGIASAAVVPEFACSSPIVWNISATEFRQREGQVKGLLFQRGLQDVKLPFGDQLADTGDLNAVF